MYVHILPLGSDIGCSTLVIQVFIWDVLFNIGQDYRLFKRHGGNLPLLVYFISRYAPFAHTFTIFNILQVLGSSLRHDGDNYVE